MIGVGIDLWQRSAGAAAFTPAALFAAGEPGDYYLMSDASARYQSGSRASPGTATAATSDPLGLWLGEGPNHRDLTATTTARPLLQLDGSSRPYALSDGVDDIIQLASMPPGSGDKATFWFVFGVPNLTGNKGLFSAGAAAGRCYAYIGTSNLNLSGNGATGAPTHGYTGIITTTPQVLVIQADLAAATIAAAFKVYRNGALLTPNSTSGAVPGGGPWQAGAFMLGDCAPAAVFGNVQYYAAGARYALSSAGEIASLNTYLGNLVGLTI